MEDVCSEVADRSWKIYNSGMENKEKRGIEALSQQFGFLRPLGEKLGSLFNSHRERFEFALKLGVAALFLMLFVSYPGRMIGFRPIDDKAIVLITVGFAAAGFLMGGIEKKAGD